MVRDGELGRAPGNFRLNICIGLFQLCAIQRDAAHFAPALEDRHDQKDILEYHPAGVFDPTPMAGREDAENRLRPVNAAQEMIGRDDDRRGNHDSPVAIKCEKGERSEDMKVRFDAAAAEMNEQC